MSSSQIKIKGKIKKADLVIQNTKVIIKKIWKLVLLFNQASFCLMNKEKKPMTEGKDQEKI